LAEKKKLLGSSANERKYTQIIKNKKIDYPQINADIYKPENVFIYGLK
jgi:hypothetical protein